MKNIFNKAVAYGKYWIRELLNLLFWTVIAALVIGLLAFFFWLDHLRFTL